MVGYWGKKSVRKTKLAGRGGGVNSQRNLAGRDIKVINREKCQGFLQERRGICSLLALGITAILHAIGDLVKQSEITEKILSPCS